MPCASCAFDRKGASIITFCRSVNCGMKFSSLPLGSAGMTLRNWETRIEGQLTKFALDGTYTIALEVVGDNCDLTNQSVSFSFLPSFLLSSYLTEWHERCLAERHEKVAHPSTKDDFNWQPTIRSSSSSNCFIKQQQQQWWYFNEASSWPTAWLSLRFDGTAGSSDCRTSWCHWNWRHR